MGGSRLIAAGAVAALLAAGCGGSDDDEKKESGPLAGNRSSLKCLTFSTLSPELYEEANPDTDPGVARLLTPGAKGAEILTGKRSAVVIEYESPSAAKAAQEDGRSWPETRDLVAPGRIRVFDRTVMLDLEGEANVRKVVEACAYRPDETPPTG